MDSSSVVHSNLVERAKDVFPTYNVRHPTRNFGASRKPIHPPRLGGLLEVPRRPNVSPRLGKCFAGGQWPPARLRFETTAPRGMSSAGSICHSPLHMGNFSRQRVPFGLQSRYHHIDSSSYSGRVACLPLHELIRVVQRMLCGAIPEVVGSHLDPGANDPQYLDKTFEISHRRFHYASYVYCIKLFDLFMEPTLLRT